MSDDLRASHSGIRCISKRKYAARWSINHRIPAIGRRRRPVLDGDPEPIEPKKDKPRKIESSAPKFNPKFGAKRACWSNTRKGRGTLVGGEVADPHHGPRRHDHRRQVWDQNPRHEQQRHQNLAQPPQNSEDWRGRGKANVGGQTLSTLKII